MKQSGGHIWVYSEVAQGTTFRIYFSRVDDPAEKIPVVDKFATSPRGSETVLIVEDDEQLLELTRSVLEGCGYSVLVAGSRKQVAVICRQYTEPIHLLLTDVVMPGISGGEVAAQVSSRWIGIKVLYMSGYAENSIVHHGVLDTGISFLPKPFTPSVLTSKVREVLEDGAPEV